MVSRFHNFVSNGGVDVGTVLKAGFSRMISEPSLAEGRVMLISRSASPPIQNN